MPDAVVAEVCSRIFASLPRSDQRRKGEQYLRGLLAAEGRKSIRNIASCVGDRAAEQSLHHFITSSTWDWRPVRTALACHVDETLRPDAWVVRPLVIPKAGQHSVGVERRFVPSLGQVVNSQQALGAWGVGADAAVPVDWRLVLSGDGRNGCPQQLREGLPPAAPVDCAAAAAAGLGRASGLRPRPVVLDLPEADPGVAVRRFAERGMHVLAHAAGTTVVTAADPVVHGLENREFTAQQLLHMVRTLRRPVDWPDPLTGAPRVSLVAGVRVELPGSGPGARHRRPLLLLGEWDSPRGWPQRCWLTELGGVAPAVLLRLAKLSLRVEPACAAVSTQVGLMDFEGRSFDGWHRHVTLASAAHAVRVLSARGERVGAGLWERPA
ncbi:transposase [Streptomyces sp. JJ36]|nr:transposase [Streptomyces sp. JJ36]